MQASYVACFQENLAVLISGMSGFEIRAWLGDTLPACHHESPSPNFPMTCAQPWVHHKIHISTLIVHCFNHINLQHQIHRVILDSTKLLVGSWLLCIQRFSVFSKVFGTCFKLMWRFEWRTFYIVSLGVKLIWAPLAMPKWVWLSKN